MFPETSEKNGLDLDRIESMMRQGDSTGGEIQQEYFKGITRQESFWTLFSSDNRKDQ